MVNGVIQSAVVLSLKVLLMLQFAEPVEPAVEKSQEKPDRVIRVRATNENNELLPDVFPVVEGSDFRRRNFEKQEDGSHLSPSLSPDRRWMWLVDGSNKDQPILFSDLIDLDDDKVVDDKGVVNAQLKIGSRLEGVLGDEVPRPIKNGFVHVIVCDGEKHQIGSLVWHEHARIKPDGTFVFESLPRDTHAQIFVICEGWQSKSPTRDEVRAYFIKHNAGGEEDFNWATNSRRSNPQLYHLDSSKGPAQISVPCRQSAAVDVRVVNSIGDPIAGATVSMSPNLLFFGDRIVAGRELSCNKLVRDGGLFTYAPGDFYKFTTKSFSTVKTDANGVARVRNIPNLSQSFSVRVKDYVVSGYPSSDPEKPWRYGVTGPMTPGIVKKMTVTMENELNLIGRELTVIDEDDKPMQDVSLTIIAIASGDQDPDWQQWSERRFGAFSKGKTDAEGNLRLLFPEKIAGGDVTSLEVSISGLYLNKTLVIPAASEGPVIRVTNQPTAEEGNNDRKRADAEYVNIFPSDGVSTKKILQTFLERKDLVSLKRLLAANQYDVVTPLELDPEMDSIGISPNKDAVKSIGTKSGERIVALASVRPKGEKWGEKPDRGFAPEAAFIFDSEGALTGVVGENAVPSQKLSLVPVGNFEPLLHVCRPESHPPFKDANRWHSINEPEKPLLTVYVDGRPLLQSTGREGSPAAEYCRIDFWREQGKNEAGAQVPCMLVWDHATEKFYGEHSQSSDGKPRYKVVVGESKSFQPVSAKRDEVTVMGGRRGFENWHNWYVVVPEGEALSARLELRDANGETLRLIQEDKLDPGYHDLQLKFGDAEAATDPDQKTLLETAVDVVDIHHEVKKFKISHFTVNQSPSLKDHASYFSGKPPLRIIEKQSTDKEQTLVWVIE